MARPAPRLLTPHQRGLLKALFADPWFRKHFYLTGGTALAAFHLFHRLSDDLDLFSHEVELTAVPGLMEAAARGLGIKLSRVQTSPRFMRFQAGDLKVDVVSDVAFRVGAPLLIGDCMVDSLKNIAVNKVCAVLGRQEPKDFVDLYFLLRDGTLDAFELLDLARGKDAGMDPLVWASLAGEVERLPLLPKTLKPLGRRAMERFFLDLRDRIIDRLKPG